MGLGHSLPFTVITLVLLYCSTSCYKTKTIKSLDRMHHSTRGQKSTCSGRDKHRRSSGHVGVLLVKVLLELGKFVQVPVFLPEPLSGVPKLSSATSTAAATSTKTRTSTITAAGETKGARESTNSRRHKVEEQRKNAGILCPPPHGEKPTKLG